MNNFLKLIPTFIFHELAKLPVYRGQKGVCYIRFNKKMLTAFQAEFRKHKVNLDSITVIRCRHNKQRNTLSLLS